MRFLRGITSLKMEIIIHSILAIHFLLIHELLATNETELKQTGVLPLGKNDIALIFYATVENTHSIPYTFGLKMEKCCLVNREFEDCESMVLHSGLSMTLEPNEVHNFSLYYSNLYLHGRKGNCSIMLRWRSRSPKGSLNKDHFGQQDFLIPFNTELPKPNFFQNLLPNDPDRFSFCPFSDDDPMNDCQPVNCLIKYSGFRNFYNQTSKSCEKCTSCLGLARNQNIILSPISNKIENLSSLMDMSDLVNNNLTNTPFGGTIATDYPNYPIKLQCVNGYTNSTISCICNEGWKSLEFPSETFNLTDTFTMCDIRSSSGEEDDRARNASTSLLILLVLVVLALSFACMFIPFALMRFRSRKVENELNEKPNGGVSHLISEIIHRREVVLPPYAHYPTKAAFTQERLGPYPNVVDTTTTKTKLGNAQQPTFEQKFGYKSTFIVESSKSLGSLSNTRNTFVTSNLNPSKKVSTASLFLPTFSRSRIPTLPEPLTPTKVKSEKYRKSEDENSKEILGGTGSGISTESLSFVALKSLLREISENSKAEFDQDIANINDFITTDKSLDSLSDAKITSSSSLQSQSQSESLIEFWENISDSEESPTETPSEQNFIDNFWVNKFWSENPITQNLPTQTLSSSNSLFTKEFSKSDSTNNNDIRFGVPKNSKNVEEITLRKEGNSAQCCSINSEEDPIMITIKPKESSEVLTRSIENKGDRW